MEIGIKLRELRKAEDLTQQQLADELQIPRVNYTRYETNAARPDYETLIKIADFFDVTLDKILTAQDNYELDNILGKLQTL